VLDHVSGMDTGKDQKAIAEMSNEDIVNVVQEERSKSVHVGNKLAELFQVSGVLTNHDRSEDSTCVVGNHKRLDWWDRVDPSNSVGDGQAVLGSGHHHANMAKDAASSVGGHGASCCMPGCFKGSDLGCSGPVARGNACGQQQLPWQKTFWCGAGADARAINCSRLHQKVVLRCDCEVRVAKGCAGCCCWKQAGETELQLQALIVEQNRRDGGLDLPHKGWGLEFGNSCVTGAANLIHCSLLQMQCLWMEVLVSLELQTWSAAVAADVVLEGQVRCVVGSRSLASTWREFSRRFG